MRLYFTGNDILIPLIELTLILVIAAIAVIFKINRRWQEMKEYTFYMMVDGEQMKYVVTDKNYNLAREKVFTAINNIYGEGVNVEIITVEENEE